MERPKALHLDKIPGLMPGCCEHEYIYKWRNKWADLEKTKKFYEQFPPEVGQTVVVLNTYAQRMEKPDVKKIEVIHKRGGIIVNHHHDMYAGVLFLRDGKNWKAPRSQCWLVPAELYKDIPKKKSDRFEMEDLSHIAGHEKNAELLVQDMIEMCGGLDRYKESINRTMDMMNLTYPEAKKLLAAELKMEHDYMGRGMVRGMTRMQNRYGRRMF